MKKSISILMFFFILPFGMCQEVVPIEIFGEHGAQAATFLGEPLAPEFYAKSQMNALIDGRNFTSSWSLTTKTSEKAPQNLQLHIANHSDESVQVVVSAEKPDDIRTFVVPVAAMEETGLDVTSLADFDQIFLISLAPISATVINDSTISEPDFLDLEVKAPQDLPQAEIFSKSTNYCSSQYGKGIRMCGFSSITNQWNCITAFADRYNIGNNVYYIRVHYPVYGAVFHNGSGAFQNLAPCKYKQHGTYSATTGKYLRWYFMADFMVGNTNSATAVYQGNPIETWYISPY